MSAEPSTAGLVAPALGAEPSPLRRLLPAPGELTPDAAMSDLRLGARAPAERPYLVLNMVSTLDGKATLRGRTAGLGGGADRELFHHLRTQADAVMVGAGTARAERYGRIVRDPALRDKRVREGLEADPLACVVSTSLDGLEDLPLLGAPEQRVAVLTASTGEFRAREAPIEYVRAPEAENAAAVDLSAALAHLRTEENVRSLLCEGGPTLNYHLLRAGLVDELFLSLAPKLAGGAAALTIVAGEALPTPVEVELVSMLEHGGELFLRMRVGARPDTGT